MANQWFKLYAPEYLTDPKIDSLNANERSCWITLMCLASISDKNGLVEFLTEESLMRKSGVEEDVKGVLKTFEKLKMITTQDNGSVVIINWNKRQGRALTGYERVKRYRENKKKDKGKIQNDNEVITNDNESDNMRIEEKRIEENRIYNTSNETLQEIPELIKSFELVNPACKKMYGNKVQRQACDDLIKLYSFEKVKNVIEKTLSKTNKLQYFPTITTPVQLRDKWVSLESAVIKYQSEKINKEKKYKVAFTS